MKQPKHGYTIYFPKRWTRWRVMNWLLDRKLVQGCFNLRETCYQQGLHVVWNNEQRLVWAFGDRE